MYVALRLAWWTRDEVDNDRAYGTSRWVGLSSWLSRRRQEHQFQHCVDCAFWTSLTWGPHEKLAVFFCVNVSKYWWTINWSKQWLTATPGILRVVPYHYKITFLSKIFYISICFSSSINSHETTHSSDSGFNFQGSTWSKCTWCCKCHASNASVQNTEYVGSSWPFHSISLSVPISPDDFRLFPLCFETVLV